MAFRSALLSTLTEYMNNGAWNKYFNKGNMSTEFRLCWADVLPVIFNVMHINIFLCLRLYAPEALCFRGVRPSVRSPYPEIASFDLYIGPLVHPTNRDPFTACPSVCPPVRLSVRRGFRAFAGERLEGMASIFACWCILTTTRTDWIMVMVCWFSSHWRHFDLVKRVKFGISGHFLENAWRE